MKTITGSCLIGAVEATVKLAVEQLSAKCGENRDRIAILAEDETADAAVLGARQP